jgi:uncharacterized protein DUF397
MGCAGSSCLAQWPAVRCPRPCLALAVWTSALASEGGPVSRQPKAQVVEVEPTGLTWCKSTASSGGGQSCVEMAVLGASVLVRDSRDRPRRLSVTLSAWAAFLRGVQDGDVRRA